MMEAENAFGRDYLPGLLGIVFTAAGPGWQEARLAVRKAVMSPTGYLHAGAVVALADTACGQGCLRALPDGADSFTTIELKSNFLGTALEGDILARAELVHGGRSTQVWDATATRAGDGKTIALFRCTQMILYPR